MVFRSWIKLLKVGGSVVLLLVILFYSILFYLSVFQTKSSGPRYDIEHLKLLESYKSKRMKKVHHARINPDIINAIAGLNHANIHLNHSTQRGYDIVYTDKRNVGPNNGQDNGRVTDTPDIFIAVKTTAKYHNTRMILLLNTWIPLARQSAYVITDEDDANLRSQLGDDHFKKSNCLKSHFRTDLVCKLSVAYDLFLQNPKRWFCVCDDDTYFVIPNLVNLLKQYDQTKDWYIGKPSLKHPITVSVEDVKKSFWFHTGGAGYCISQGLALKMSPYARGGRLRDLANKLKAPDDIAMGYIINHLLNVDITYNSLFHSHLESLWRLDPHTIKDQITLSYGEFDSNGYKPVANLVNTGTMIPTYPPSTDPTRIKSVHCYLFPHALECKKFGVATLRHHNSV